MFHFVARQSASYDRYLFQLISANILSPEFAVTLTQSEAWALNARTLDRLFESRLRQDVCVMLSCVVTGLATRRSLVQGVLQCVVKTDYGIKGERERRKYDGGPGP
jgi:hypothetical protein